MTEKKIVNRERSLTDLYFKIAQSLTDEELRLYQDNWQKIWWLADILEGAVHGVQIETCWFEKQLAGLVKLIKETPNIVGKSLITKASSELAEQEKD